MWSVAEAGAQLLFSLLRFAEGPGMLLLLLLLLVAVLTDACVSGARVVSGQTVCLGEPQRPCYKIAYFQEVWSRVAFREASEACRMDGGSLLSIQSPGEQKDIENLLQEMRSGAVGGAGAAGGIADGDYWIGLVRVDDHAPAEAGSTSHSCSDLYRWTDGSPASFRNWYFDEPSCGGEACVVMYHQPAALPGLGGAYLYQWNDDRCNMKHNFICKYHPGCGRAAAPLAAARLLSTSSFPFLFADLVREQGDARGGRGTGEEVTPPPSPLRWGFLLLWKTDFFLLSSEATAGGGGVKPSTEDVPSQVTTAGSSGMLLLSVILPTIPLFLLILVASGTCCFQLLKRSSRAKTEVHQPNLWISESPGGDAVEA